MGGSEGGSRSRNVAAWLGVGSTDAAPRMLLGLQEPSGPSATSPDPGRGVGGGEGQVAEAGGMASTSMTMESSRIG